MKNILFPKNISEESNSFLRSNTIKLYFNLFVFLMFSLLSIQQASAQCTDGLPTAGAILGNQTICTGGNPAAFTSPTAGTGTGISYRWESSLSPFTTWVPISAANAATYDAPSGLTATTQYRRITVSTNTCESVPTASVTVTVTPIVTINPFSPTTSARCQGAGTVMITTTANNSTGITYSLDTTTAGFSGNSINSATGAVTFAAGWSGNTTITARAAGCSGPVTTTHTVTTNPLPTITGSSLVGQGSSITLTGSASAATSNPWVSSNTAIATVTNGGIVTGVSAGSFIITYTNSNGCQIIKNMTVTSPLLDNDNDGKSDNVDLDDDNDGLTDINEGCGYKSVLAVPTSGLATSLNNTGSALFPLDPFGPAVLPNGGINMTVVAGYSNTSPQ